MSDLTIVGTVTATSFVGAGTNTGPTKTLLPAIAGAALTVTHGKGREVDVGVFEVATGQRVNAVVKNVVGNLNAITVDFGAFTSGANTFYVLVD